MKGLLYTNFKVCALLLFLFFQFNAAKPHQDVQDVIVNNVVVQPGLVDCQRYYNVIKPILDRYKRPITVLDLGAGQGYFSFRIAHDYDSTCVMVENNDCKLKLADDLLALCHLNSGLRNIVLLGKKMTCEELEKLADCEHFDVVLAFDYIDEMRSDWIKVANVLLRMGDNLFIQAPYSNVKSENKNIGKIAEFFAKRSGKLLLQTPRVLDSKIEEQLFLVEGRKKGLRSRCFCLESDDSFLNLFRIESTYSHKIFIKNGDSTGPEWKRGINMVTFLVLEGLYPTREMMKQEITKLTQSTLTDFLPKNLIIQGDNIVLIDQRDRFWREVDVQKSLQYIIETLEQRSSSGALKLLAQGSWRHKRKFLLWKKIKHLLS